MGSIMLTGLDRLEASTRLLQRVRRVDPVGGPYEAADLQWWWRRPRRSDVLELPVWVDDDGPVGAALLVDWGDRWEGLAPVVPDAFDRIAAWRSVVDAARSVGLTEVEALVREGDAPAVAAMETVGFRSTGARSGVTWMDANERPPVPPLAAGFRLVDRTRTDPTPHPMVERNGPGVEERLHQTSLYDPWLDLAVVDPFGEVAGYALFWFDEVTGVGLVEPMRVHEPFRRRGLATSLLLSGIDRLARRGADRLKVGYDGDAGRALYLGAGFVDGPSMLSYCWSSG